MWANSAKSKNIPTFLLLKKKKKPNPPPQKASNKAQEKPLVYIKFKYIKLPIGVCGPTAMT